MFIDPASGDSWVEFRDDREAQSKAGFSDPLSPCSAGSVGCYQFAGQPLLSALPLPGFLGGAYRFSARPKRYWNYPCTEISAVSDRGTTTSVVCEAIGLVEFSFVVTGSLSPLERYQLRSFNGLFAQR